MNLGKIFHLISLLIFSFSLLSNPFSFNSIGDQQNDLTFVYATNHYSINRYNSAFYPPQVKNIHLLAGKTSIIAAKLTDVYFWPLTGEYKADWDNANINVKGTVEILSGDRIIEDISQTEYVIQYDGVDIANSINLYLGSEANEKYEEFLDLREKYREDLFSYSVALSKYESEYEKVKNEIKEGLSSVDDLPESPKQPADLTLFSSEVLLGYPISLPVGSYKIRLRSDEEEIVKGSEKKLIVFSAISQSVGYEIIAENRWTASEYSSEPNDVIFVLNNENVFLEPVVQLKFNEEYFERMNSPQNSSARSDRSVWVAESKMENRVLSTNSEIDFIYQKDYTVQQSYGTRLGYEINEFQPFNDTQPTFTAFKIITNNINYMEFKLSDCDNSDYFGSERVIRIINPNDKNYSLYFLSLIPLFFGFYRKLFSKSKK